MRPTKKPIIIDGVKHWKCSKCHKVKLEREFYKRASTPCACKTCSNKVNVECNALWKAKRLRPADDKDWIKDDKELLKSLQAWEPSWTMERLNAARSENK